MKYVVSRNRWLSIAIVLLVAADWLTKLWVQNEILYARFRPVIAGWVWLTHRRNTGVAFSVLADTDTWWRTPLLALGALLGIGICVRMIRGTHDAVVQWAAALVIAGAVGNLGDRLVNGWVTDFILVRYFPFVFNVADVAISIGAVLLAYRMLLEPRPEPTAA